MKEEFQASKIIDSQILKRLFSFILPYKKEFVLLVFFIILNAILTPVLPLMIQHTIDVPIAQGDYNMLSLWLGLLVIYLIINSLIAFLNTYYAGLISQKIIRDIRIRVFDKILNLRLKFYDETPIGRLITRTISDVESLSDVFSSGFAAIAGDLLQLVLIIIVMFFTNVKLTFISLCTIPLMMISTYIFKEKVKKSFNTVRNAVANLNSFLQEHISGMSLIQIFNVEEQEFKKFEKLNTEHKNANIKSILYYSIYYPVADLIAALTVGLIVWAGSKGMLHEDVSFGTITAFIMFINLFFKPIRMIADRVNTLQMGIVSVSRIIEILDNKEFNEKGGLIKVPIEGRIEFKNVSFGYVESQTILKNLNFEIIQGESIAIVGATGSGKTTIISLLNKFYELSEGQILIDGKDIQEFDNKYLRKNIGFVLQDVFLFSSRIADNLRLGDKSITEEMIIKASKMVGVHDFIMQLPQNYNFKVMERGNSLSVGQRQLLSFVRAILHDPKIIVLDEATSSIDTESEELIQNGMRKLLTGRTSIVIAHRLSTIQNADRIIVLDKGIIKEMGSHPELLKKNGIYAKLYAMQFDTI